MEFETVAAPKIKELFMDRVIGLVLSGKLEAGEKFPPEREIATEMGVSKTIIHSGLAELERMGFVNIKPRKGTFVANYAEFGTQETLNALLKYNGGKLDINTVISMFEFRIVLEGAAFKKFAENQTDEDIEALQQIVDRVNQMASDKEKYSNEEFAEEIFSFHHTICARSGNNVFPLVLNAFRTVSIVFWINGIRMYGREVSASHTEKYFEHLRNRDAASALEYLHADFDYFLANVK